MEKQIQLQYRYLRIADDQFATFEENYNPTSNVEFQNSVSFSYDYDNKLLSCLDTITFMQEEKVILKLGLSSYFMLHPDCVSELMNDGKLCCPKEFLWQFASLNYGSIRGVLYERTKDSELNALILPPFYFDQLIKDGICFDKKE